MTAMTVSARTVSDLDGFDDVQTHRKANRNGYARNWISGAQNWLHRRRLMSILRRASSSLGLKRKGLGLGALGAGTGAVLISGGAAMFAPGALASTCGDGTVVTTGGVCTLNMNGFNPVNNDNQVGAVVVNDGSSVTLNGSGTSIVRGTSTGTVIWLADAFTAGLLTSNSQYGDVNNVASLVVNTGTLSRAISVIDPVTGATRTVLVYNNANIVDTHAGKVEGDYGIISTVATGDNQYINARFGTVTNGQLAVNIGNTASAIGSAENSIVMIAKQTYLTEASSAGAAASVVWNSHNYINLGNIVNAAATAAGTPGIITNPFSAYNGTFTTTFGGVTTSHTVNDAAGLRAYNDFLVAEMQAGRLATNNYTSAFAMAYTNTLVNVGYSPNSASDPNDDTNQPMGARAVIHATGASATGTVSQTGQIDVYDTNQDARVGGNPEVAVLLAENGGTVINNGQVSYRRGGGGSTWGMKAAAGGHAVNNGVLNAGFLASTLGNPVNPNLTTAGASLGLSYGIQATGAGSTFANGGILNLFGPNAVGLQMTAGASGTNTGIVNAAVGSVIGETDFQATGVVNAVQVASSTFNNSGTIYLGRGAQYNAASPEAVTDTSNGTTPVNGIYVSGAASNVTNSGNIIIGSRVQNANGISIINASGTVVNSGTITVNGAVAGLPAENVAINAINTATTSISHQGTINLNGVNSTAIKVTTTGTATGTVNTTAASVINVAGGADPTTGTRNFGVWVDGQGTGVARANLNGQINLTGDGAIAVHARGKSRVDISAGAVPHFNSGTDQIGFFIYGADAVVNVATSVMDVSTDRSTLFRIAEGADLSANGMVVTVSGDNAVGIVGTGTGTDINATGGTFNLTGTGATGVLIEGGATGTIGATTVMNMLGQGTTVGVVDGQKHDLTGNPVGAPNAATSLVVRAQIASTQNGATSLVARNLGQLSVTGNIGLTGAGSTGILAESGGIVGVTGATVNVNGWAARAEGPASNTSTFTVTNATMTGSDGLFNASNSARANLLASGSTLNGLITTAADSVANVTLSGSTVWTMNGASNMTSLANNATINVTDGATDDRITTTNYAGSGILRFDVDFVNNVSDILVVAGDVISGVTSILVRPITTLASGRDILVVDVTGASPAGMFSLANGPLTIDGRVYTLMQKGLDWFLTTPCRVTNVASSELGCVSPDTIDVTTGTLTGDIEGAGDVDIINVTGDASVGGIVRGGEEGFDDSALSDAGDLITINTTGTVGGVDGNLGDDQIWLLGGTVTGNALGSEGNDQIVLNGATVNGIISGGVGDDGISLLSGTTGSVEGNDGNDSIALNGATVTGAISGGAGADTIDLLAGNTASVAGDDGNDVITLAGATVAGAINAGASDDAMVWSSGTASSLLGGVGSDTLLITSATYDGSQLLDGGDDVSSADGFVDTLTLQGVTVNVTGANLTNWENLIIDGGNVEITDGAINVGSDTGLGLTVQGGGVLDGGSALVLTGNMAVTSAGTFDATGGGAGFYSISGTLANAGMVTSQDGTAGDQIAVAGNYTGGGSFVIDTVLGNDSSVTDILVIDGTTSGTTTLLVSNAGGAGAATNNGILVVRTSDFAGSFTLAGGAITAGDYTYNLQQGADGWYLVSTRDTPEVPAGIYEALPSALFQKMPTLEQRVGQRQWLGRDSERAGEINPSRGAWMRIWGDKSDIHPSTSTTGTDAQRSDWGLQLGYDHALDAGDNGQWVFGLTAQYGRSSTNVTTADGYGSIKSDGLGMGVTATWYGDNGFYTDLQGQVSRLTADVDANGDLPLLDGKTFTAMGLSAEVGYRYKLDKNQALVPQAQLTWSRISGGSFVDQQGTAVSLGSSTQMIGRIGLAYEYEYSEGWLLGDRAASSHTRHREKLYVIGNILHNFSGDTGVSVDGIGLSQSNSGTWAEIGIGGSMTWDENKTVFVEVSGRKALGGSDASGLSVSAGFRMQF